MSRIEPLCHLELDNKSGRGGGEFVSLWRYKCLPGCLVVEKPKHVDVLSSAATTMDECFESEWLVLVNADELKKVSESVNRLTNYRVSYQLYDVLKKNGECESGFVESLKGLNVCANAQNSTTSSHKTKQTERSRTLFKVYSFLFSL